MNLEFYSTILRCQFCRIYRALRYIAWITLLLCFLSHLHGIDAIGKTETTLRLAVYKWMKCLRKNHCFSRVTNSYVVKVKLKLCFKHEKELWFLCHIPVRGSDLYRSKFLYCFAAFAPHVCIKVLLVIRLTKSDCVFSFDHVTFISEFLASVAVCPDFHVRPF